jgi:GTP-binding protein
VYEQFKALIILFNKDDLVDETIKEEIRFTSSVYDYFLKKVPQLYISCMNGKNVGKILPLVKKVWDHANLSISNEDLTFLFKEALEKKPLYHKSSLLMIYRVKQIGKNPLAFSIVVNEPKWFGPSQLGFFDNLLRSKYDLAGVPIKFVTKKRA